MRYTGRWFAQIRMATLSLFRRDSETARLGEELQFHLEQQVRENIAAGATPEEAHKAALRSFGNPTLLREQARATWSWHWLEVSARDLRYGTRRLLRSPGFACIAILVMALGIGAATSLFTMVRSVLLKPLPFRDPDRLVTVYEHFRGNTSGDGLNLVSPADFRDWRAQTHGFEDMGAWRPTDFNLSGEHSELPEVIEGAGFSFSLLTVLGVEPVIGRNFTAQEDEPDANHVALLTWSLYQRRFGGNPSILGRQIHLNSDPWTIIGVLPSCCVYPDARSQIIVPWGQTYTPEQFSHHDMHQTHVVARMRPGASAVAAVKEIGALQYQLHLQHASEPVAEEVRWRPMIDDVVQDVKKPLLVLLSAVGCMLLIACLNVSNLLVARSAARRKEVAVRGALGGSRLALIREQMTESLLICMAGGTLGLLLSIAVTHWFATHWSDLPRAETVHIDGTVFLFSASMIVFCALFAGLLPAISSTGAGVLAALQESSRSIGGSVARATLRRTLLVAEIALTVILLVTAGLLFKSFLHLRTTDLGCATDHTLTMKYTLPRKQYDTPAKISAFHESLLERVRRVPGIRAAALVSTPPGEGRENDAIFTIPGHPIAAGSLVQNDAMYYSIDPAYFSAMQIPLIHGRVFSEQERLDRYHYIVVNKKFADQYFPGDTVIGRHISMIWANPLPESFEIIGVVGDTLYEVARPVMATVYFPIFAGLPMTTDSATLVVRTFTDPLNFAVPVQQQFAAIDPSLPVSAVLTMQQILGRSTASANLSATLLLAFAILSLLLAAIGLYGVLSYLVTQRITEIGIRIALGAQRREVLRLVLFDGLKPVFIGLLLGISGGLAAGAIIRSQLFGTSPYDPLVFVSMVFSLLLTAVIACAVPAIRASRIDPMQALRAE